MKIFMGGLRRRFALPKNGKRARRAQRASAMVATLCTISVGSLMAAGVATASFSSYSRTLADQNSAKALDMAECAAQYQMQRMLSTTDRAPVAYNGSNLETATYGTTSWPMPVTSKSFTSGSTTGTLNNFMGANTARADGNSDYVIAWIQYPDSSSGNSSVGSASGININVNAGVLLPGTNADLGASATISQNGVSAAAATSACLAQNTAYVAGQARIDLSGLSPRALTCSSQDDVYVYGEARIGNQWRRVRMTAGSGSLFDTWGCYGHTSIKLNATLTCGPLTGSAKGCIASNGQISLKTGSTCGQQTVFGSCVAEPTLPYVWGGGSCDIPTCHTTACNAHTCGGYYVSPNASTSTCGIRRFQGTVSNSSCNDNYTCGRVYAGGGYTVPMSGTGNQGSYQYNTCYLKGKGTSTTANFYMKGCQGSNRGIYCDVSNGPVNLWIDSDDTDGDSLTGACDIAAYESTDWFGNPICTASAARKFHIFYYNSNGCPLKFNLSSATTRRVCGMVHCFNKDKDVSGNDVASGDIQVNGTGLTVIGAMNANNISGSGSLSITFAPRGTGEDSSGSYFARRGGFQEILPPRGN